MDFETEPPSKYNDEDLTELEKCLESDLCE